MRPLEYDSPKVDEAYFFFEDFFAGFFAAAFFFAAIKLTCLSCRTGPHGRAYLAKHTGFLRQTDRMGDGVGIGETTTFNIHRTFEVVFPVRGDHRFNLIVNMRSLSHIVKQLFIKIVIPHPVFHVRSTEKADFSASSTRDTRRE